MRRRHFANQATQATRKPLGNRIAVSMFSRRSAAATLGQRRDQGPLLSRKTRWSCHGEPSNTPAMYGRRTLIQAASLYWERSAATAGVAITASRIQLGQKSAIFIDLREEWRDYAAPSRCSVRVVE